MRGSPGRHCNTFTHPSATAFPGKGITWAALSSLHRRGRPWAKVRPRTPAWPSLPPPRAGTNLFFSVTKAAPGVSNPPLCFPRNASPALAQSIQCGEPGLRVAGPRPRSPPRSAAPRLRAGTGRGKRSGARRSGTPASAAVAAETPRVCHLPPAGSAALGYLLSLQWQTANKVGTEFRALGPGGSPLSPP